MTFRITPIVSILLLCVSAAGAQSTRPAERSLFDPARHMRVSEVKPGMKGFGLSVFYGAKIERFDVEVLSILKNFNAQQDVLLVRLSKQNLEHSGGIAGMSGSPIFLIDEQGRERMVGAFAYGWSLSKDPIGGVQPIEYMLNVPEVAIEEHAAAGAKWILSDSVALPGSASVPARYPFAAWGSFEPNPNRARRESVNRLRPMSVPLSVSGMSPELLHSFDPMMRSFGWSPMQAGGGAAFDGPAPKLEPGSALALPLVTGDLEISAIGTTTEVIDGHVWGFGHAFNAEGATAMPMGSGYVNGIISSIMQSFKLGALAEVQGTIYGDSNVGVAGKIGAVPDMTDVSIRVVYEDGSLDHTYRYRGVKHPKFSPVIGGFALATSVTAWNELPQHHTLEYDVKMTFDSGEIVEVKNIAVDESIQTPYFDVMTPLLAAADNPFGRVLPKKIEGTVLVKRDAKMATILSVNIPRLKLKPGDAVKGYVTLRPFRGEETVVPFEMPLPKDLPPGQYSLSVGDFQRYLQDEFTSRPFRFSAENIDEVFEVIQDFASIRRDAMYVRLLRQADGVAVGRVAMPALPGSRRMVMLASGRSNVTPFVSSAVQTLAMPFVVNGSADFVITIDKTAKPVVGAAAGEATTQPAQ